MERICLVGNAPSTTDRSRLIDGSETVIRFNNAAGFGSSNGSRTTHLFLINCGGQAREWLETPDFAARPVVAQAGEILLPIHPAKDELHRPPLSREERTAPDARNYAEAMLAMLEGKGRSVTLLPPRLFLDACRIIGYARPERGMDAPSTGLIGLLWALEHWPGPIDVVGFGFDGWAGHRWEKERAFFAARQAEGRVRLHPPD